MLRGEPFLPPETTAIISGLSSSPPEGSILRYVFPPAVTAFSRCFLHGMGSELRSVVVFGWELTMADSQIRVLHPPSPQQGKTRQERTGRCTAQQEELDRSGIAPIGTSWIQKPSRQNALETRTSFVSIFINRKQSSSKRHSSPACPQELHCHGRRRRTWTSPIGSRRNEANGN